MSIINYIRYINKMDTCSTQGQFTDKINHISFWLRWYVDISAHKFHQDDQ